MYMVHRLVAQTFIPNPLNLPHVNHKDEDKTNNRVDNLEWCDARYNINYGTAKRRRGEYLKNRIDFSKPVEQYTLEDEYVARYPSAMQAERETDISNSHIIEVCKGKRKSIGGYVWKYKREAI